MPDDAYSPVELGALVVRLLDALELQRAVFAGASWGAIVGAFAAARFPERFGALVMLDGGYIDPPGEPSETLAEVRAHWRQQPGFRFASWEETLEGARGYFSRWSPELELAVRRGLREEDGEIVSIAGPELYGTVQWWLRQEPPTSVLPALGRASVPVLLLFATEPPERAREHEPRVTKFAELVPQAVIEPVEGAGHWLLEDQPVEVAHAIGNWLRSL